MSNLISGVSDGDRDLPSSPLPRLQSFYMYNLSNAQGGYTSLAFTKRTWGIGLKRNELEDGRNCSGLDRHRERLLYNNFCMQTR